MGSVWCKDSRVANEKVEGVKSEETGMNSLNVPSNTLTAKAPVGRSEYGRVKIALPKGKGLLDWIHLSTGKIIAKKRLPSVDEIELQKHSTRDDCWVLLFGNVYDVTKYLDFHPGGIPELMRAAGTDATVLFNQYHAWVNYDSMLKSCLVGRFDGDSSKLPLARPSTVDVEMVPSSSGAGEELGALSHSTADSHNIKVEMGISGEVCISCPQWNSRNLHSDSVSLFSLDSSLRLLIKTFDENAPLELVWDSLPHWSSGWEGVSVVVEDSTIHLSFPPSSDLSFPSEIVNSTCRVKESPRLSYHKYSVYSLAHSPVSSSPLSLAPSPVPSPSLPSFIPSQLPRDCILLILQPSSSHHLSIPIGHHVELKVRKGGSTVSRPYTPIEVTQSSLSSLFNDEMERMETDEEDQEGKRLLVFLIKVYHDGIVTPAIAKLRQGDTVEVSDPIGSMDFSLTPPPLFPLSKINEDRRIVCIAAGTGLTPMLRVIRTRGEERCRLVVYNKKEEDRPDGIWMNIDKEQLEIVHVLSEASESWKGLRGRISRENLGEVGGEEVVFVCGPEGFIQSTAKLLLEIGHSSDLVHIFQG